MKRIPTSGEDGLWREFHQPGDDQLLFQLQTMAMAMTVEDMKRFCEGTMTALVVVQDQFRKRFPAEWIAWNARFEDSQ